MRAQVLQPRCMRACLCLLRRVACVLLPISAALHASPFSRRVACVLSPVSAALHACLLPPNPRVPAGFWIPLLYICLLLLTLPHAPLHEYLHLMTLQAKREHAAMMEAMKATKASLEALSQNRKRNRSRSPDCSRHRQRSRSPDRDDYSAKKKRSSYRDNGSRDDRKGDSDGSFCKGAGRTGPSVCAICLTKDSAHARKSCTSETLWNGSAAFAKRADNNAVVAKSGKTRICVYWNLPKGCQSDMHRDSDGEDVCSGCGASDHGAQSCPRCEK
jgi:hypothetical protein